MFVKHKLLIASILASTFFYTNSIYACFKEKGKPRHLIRNADFATGNDLQPKSCKDDANMEPIKGIFIPNPNETDLYSPRAKTGLDFDSFYVANNRIFCVEKSKFEDFPDKISPENYIQCVNYLLQVFEKESKKFYDVISSFNPDMRKVEDGLENLSKMRNFARYDMKKETNKDFYQNQPQLSADQEKQRIHALVTLTDYLAGFEELRNDRAKLKALLESDGKKNPDLIKILLACKIY